MGSGLKYSLILNKEALPHTNEGKSLQNVE